ncbi:hypothetical protein DV532_03770 [Pseudomonas sp. Leaf58]|nr:hypothetical protein DV532_03770 [Pseudomonas sp. Leaf58]
MPAPTGGSVCNVCCRWQRTLFTLVVVTVLALPINIIAGFFGMNVGGVCWWGAGRFASGVNNSPRLTVLLFFHPCLR